MSVPSGAMKVTYEFSVTNPEEVMYERREFELNSLSTQVWSQQESNNQIETMMDNYLEDINTTYPVSGGYTVGASRSYTCQNIEGDTWPTP